MMLTGNKLIKVRSEVNRVLEIARNDKVIGGGLEAEVTVYANDEYRALLEQLGDELRFVLITSKAEVKALADKPADVAAGELEGIAVSVARSTVKNAHVVGIILTKSAWIRNIRHFARVA